MSHHSQREHSCPTGGLISTPIIHRDTGSQENGRKVPCRDTLGLWEMGSMGLGSLQHQQRIDSEVPTLNNNTVIFIQGDTTIRHRLQQYDVKFNKRLHQAYVVNWTIKLFKQQKVVAYTNIWSKLYEVLFLNLNWRISSIDTYYLYWYTLSLFFTIEEWSADEMCQVATLW